ncbi:MAG: hypothetical protein PUB89_03915 [Oscillospiraceae bacterium]|nr:hypothetical protein [Oscillospiraceae bacterium]MDD6081981.1 hypothetical protein [Oscillospiraceae bacterium]
MATFYNQATLSYNDTTTNSNIVTGELVEVLTATKTAIPANYRAGDRITYIVSIQNSGTTALTGVEISDNLGEYAFSNVTLVPLSYVDGSVRYYVNGDITASPAVTAGPPLEISGITVPANGNALIIYQADVNAFAPLETASTITNTASITGAGLLNAVTAAATVTADDSANLSITKSLSPETVTENGELTYTFVIQNTGNTAVTVTDNAIVTDTFDPVLNPISVTFNGTAWTAPANYTYDTATGEFATIAGQITVPAATYTQDPVTGAWITQPGVSTLKITGTV